MEEQNQRYPYTYDNEEDNKRANKLCIISLACVFAPLIISAILMAIISALTDSYPADAVNFINNILGSVNTLAIIAGIALMIYVRVKYPKNIFGKVLMWLYIIIAALAVIVFILYMIFALVTCISCFACLSDMPG